MDKDTGAPVVRLTSGYHYIPVSNLEQARDWYAENLGFRVVKEDKLYLDLRTDSGVRILLLPSEGNLTSNMLFPNGQQAAHGFIVANIAAVYQRFVDKGIKVGKLFDYDGTSFSFFDPDGNKIELWSDVPNK